MQHRLEQFLEAENISKAQFADSINVARAGISHIMAGRNKPSYEFIVNTMEAYPLLNIEWLLTGRGNMYKDGNDNIVENDLFSVVRESAEVPAAAPVHKVQKTVDEEAGTTMNAATKKDKAKRVMIFYNDGTYEEFC